MLNGRGFRPQREPLILGAWLLAACAPTLSQSGAETTTAERSAVAARVALDEAALAEVAAASCPAPRGNRIELSGLLDEIADLAPLSELDQPGYVSLLSSSFDRASSAAAPGESEWFANRDFVDASAGEPVVILDAVGPGVVTRIWSANPSGTLRVFLDGAASPTIQAPMAALLDGEVQPLGAPYAYASANGHNLYFPIPFGRRCRITVETDSKRFFYQVDYRKYADATQVQTFSAASLAEAGCQKARTAARLQLAASGVLPMLPATESFELAVEQGKRSERRISAAEGGSEIRELRIRPSVRDADALRGTMLAIEFDGEQTVQAPLVDFFGTGPSLAAVRSLPVTVDVEQGALIARWPMPFKTSATIALTGASSASFKAMVEVSAAPRRFEDTTLYFGAQWHAPGVVVSTPPHDWSLVAIKGAGKYVGTLLNVQNGDVQWWGEGDERIWVDEEQFPSHFGTGTEDYFGYGWCSNEVFTTAFNGQTQSSGKQNWGGSSLYRFHVLDAVAFRSGLRFDLEARHWRKVAVPLVYDGIAFFYVRPGAEVQPRASLPAEYRVPVAVNPPLEMDVERYTCGGD